MRDGRGVYAGGVTGACWSGGSFAEPVLVGWSSPACALGAVPICGVGSTNMLAEKI
jgi:hypothetical protein